MVFFINKKLKTERQKGNYSSNHKKQYLCWQGEIQQLWTI